MLLARIEWKMVRVIWAGSVCVHLHLCFPGNEKKNNEPDE